MIVLEIVFWASLALIVYAHAGYPLLLGLLSRAFGESEAAYEEPTTSRPPSA